MRIEQINLNHCEAAQELLKQRVYENKVDVVLVSDQHKNLNVGTWVSDRKSKAAIWACGGNTLQDKPHTDSDYYTQAKICGIYFYSCYAPPKLTQAEFENLLDELVQNARGTTPNVIAGDFNAWALEWGSRYTNKRGDALIKAFSLLDAVLLNTGGKNTFEVNGRASIIDITYASRTLVRSASRQVCYFYTGSDHLAIKVDFSHGKEAVQKKQNKGWRVETLDEEMFQIMLEENPTSTNDLELQAELLVKHVSRACDAAMCRKRQSAPRKPVYWWNEEISTLRSECKKARRLSQRSYGLAEHYRLRENYKKKRKQLKKAIKSSKAASFKELCQNVDENPWGDGYKLVMAKVKGGRGQAPTCPILLEKIVQTLFPKQDMQPSQTQFHAAESSVTISEAEVILATESFGNAKAPGPDGIPNKALKIAIRRNAKPFAEHFTKCINEGRFPKVWKKQQLVLLQKPNKPAGDPSSYRPLCMIDTMGKILERLICKRLEQHLEKVPAELSEHQFGFRKGRSTIDAVRRVTNIASKAIEGDRWMHGDKEYCAVVTLDVRNAFNSAYWPHIIKALEEKKTPAYLVRVINSYLSERVLLYNTDEGPKRYAVTGGVPQGSVLGPILWNVLYDGVLQLPMPREVQIIGYADDIALTIVAKTIPQIQSICSEATTKVKQWLTAAKLQLAGQKTEAVLITSRKKLETTTLNIDGFNVTTQAALRYLGVMIDARLSFKEHIKKACGKAAKVTAALSRIMANIGGPTQSRRALLAKVTQSTLMYAAPIWGKALIQKTYAKKAEIVFRLSALRVACAFRTVSFEAVCVISGIMPPDIMASELGRVYDKAKSLNRRLTAEERKQERRGSIIEWQNRWDLATKGRWTHKLIRSVQAWVERGHGDTDYYLTQFLTGHGCYREYLHRLGHEDAADCSFCGNGSENVEHVFFSCPRYAYERMSIEEIVKERITPGNIVDHMLQSKLVWTKMREWSANALQELRKKEWERSKERRQRSNAGDININEEP